MAAVPAIDHAHLQPLFGRTITHASLEWIDWTSGSAPLLIRLDFAPAEPAQPESTVWVAAGCWREKRFTVGTGELTVIFNRADAIRAGLVRKEKPDT